MEKKHKHVPVPISNQQLLEKRESALFSRFYWLKYQVKEYIMMVANDFYILERVGMKC